MAVRKCDLSSSARAPVNALPSPSADHDLMTPIFTHCRLPHAINAAHHASRDASLSVCLFSLNDLTHCGADTLAPALSCRCVYVIILILTLQAVPRLIRNRRYSYPAH
jgi:hypothetical protein